MENRIILETKNVFKKINNKIILKERSDIFYEDKIYILYGNSGSGKSTYLSCLAFLNDYNGSIYYKNIDLKKINATSYYLNNLGYVSQETLLSSYLTVFQMIELSWLIYSTKNNNYEFINCKEIIKNLNILHLKNSFEEELSGGEKYRVNLAISLIGNKKLVILDEPTASLDKENVNNCINFIHDYKKKNHTCFIIVSHDESIKKIADYCINII